MNKKVLSLGMAAVSAVSAITPAFAVPQVSGDGQSVPVELTVEKPTFSVTVPTGLPVAVDAAGKVYCSTNATIKNNTFGQVKVSNVIIEGNNPWTVADWALDMQKEKVNTSKIAIQLNTGVTGAAGYQFAAENFPVMDGHGSLPLTYDAKLPAQTKVIPGNTVANVTFIVGWNETEATGYELTPPKDLVDIIDENGVAQVKVGDQIRLEAAATYALDEAPTYWSCPDTGVLEIIEDAEDHCIAKIVGPGSTTVTYTKNGTSGELQFNSKAPLKSITLDHESLTLNKGNESDLHVTYNPANTTDSKTVQWSSDHSDIVSVVDGHLVAKNWGKAVITATVGGKHTASCVVTVPKIFNGVTLSEHNITMKNGTQHKLTATALYREAPVWSVIEGNCVTVNDGNITATAPGIAKVQVQIGKFTDICTVKVTPVPVNPPHSTNAPLDKATMDTQLANLTGTITFSRDKAPVDATTPLNSDGSVVAKIVDQDATVYSKNGGGVAAPADSSILFYKGNPDNFGYKAKALNLDGLDTSKVTDMHGMFQNSAATIITGLNSFDTSNVTNMEYMFSRSAATTLDLSKFDTSMVTNMRRMFRESAATTLDVSNFNTSNVTNMFGMFDDCKSTTLDVRSFDTSNVMNMGQMFWYSAATTLDLSSFDTSKVWTMQSMFQNSAATSLDLSSFDTSNVTTMESMFENSAATTLDVSSFDTSNVTNMNQMFSASKANIIIGLNSFDTSKVTDMFEMFWNTLIPALDLSSFDVSKANIASMISRWTSFTRILFRTETDMNKIKKDGGESGPTIFLLNIPASDFSFRMTQYLGRLTGTITFSTQKAPTNGTIPLNEDGSVVAKIVGQDATVYSKNGGKIKAPVDSNGLFMRFRAKTINLDGLDTSNVTNMRNMFRYSKATTLDLSSFDTSKVTDMKFMFQESAATTIDGLSSFDTSKVTDMGFMFDTSAATALDLSSFDTRNVTDMYGMFKDSAAKSLDLSSFNTSNVTDMNWMFCGSAATTLDLSSFDTSKVTDMNHMFSHSAATTITGLSRFDTSKVTDMNYMFNGSVATTLDVSSFNTSEVKNMENMFAGISKIRILDLSSFDVSKANVYQMFNKNSYTSKVYCRTEADKEKLSHTYSTSFWGGFVVGHP